MKKFLAYYFIYRTTKNPMMAAQIYQIIYGGKKQDDGVSLNSLTKKPVEVEIKTIENKSELEQSLNYLKNKSVKTKKDKESINILESILQNY